MLETLHREKYFERDAITMIREFKDYIHDINNEMKKIIDFTNEMSYNDFKKDEKTVYAVIRALEIIGEATKNIPDKIKTKYNNIPWRNISGMRDKVIHDYFGVNRKIIWETVKNDIPDLLEKIEKIIKNEF